MKSFLSPKSLAQALGVSESSVRRWIDSGTICTSRTVGGHRKIPVAEAVRFVRNSRLGLLRPDLLGLGPVRAAGRAPAGEEAEHLFELLRSGDASAARSLILSGFLAGRGVAELCDELMREAMHRLGELWRHESRGIFLEHRGTDIMLTAMQQLRLMLGAPPEHAPVAVGGAGPDDPYQLPSLMAATVLSELGWRSVNLGANTPLRLLSEALEEYRPRLLWLSFSTPVGDMEEDWKALGAALQRHPQTQLAVGGRHAGELARPGGALPAQVTRLCTMRELAALARGLMAG